MGVYLNNMECLVGYDSVLQSYRWVPVSEEFLPPQSWGLNEVWGVHSFTVTKKISQMYLMSIDD
jgi:hypothetical protein